jgi:transposase InsO family protein
MVGKLEKSSPGGFEYLLVAIDKFSKWIEAKPVRKADGATALKFVCSLVTRFGIPHSIITDNGTNFAQGELKDYCHDVGIRLDLASVAHPQSNGQVERANGLLLSGIKPRLEEPLRRAAGAWAEELDSVLWSLRTTPNRSTGFTPFFLVYGSEAVLPSDIIHDSPRVSAYNEETADEARQLSVDLIEEARNLADQRSTIYQQKLQRYHSRRVRNRSFMVGDLVLRLRQVKDHKLQSPWEGPFVVSKVLHNGSYYLVDFRELRDRPANWHRKRKREDPGDIYDETDRPWNISQLRPFHT